MKTDLILDERINNNCLIIGEIAQAHDGSLGTAHAYIDAVAKAGADAIKFQTHIAAAESTLAEPWRVKFSVQDTTRYDYWKRMEFTPEQWAGLKQHSEEKGLIFLSSPFSIEAFELLEQIGTPAWKIASGEVTNNQLLDRMLATKKLIFLSSGMSPISETDFLVEKIKRSGNSLAVLQCTSKYPTPPEQLGLNMLSLFKKRYSCPVGLSDHSGTIFSGLAAASLGANILEVHVVFSRETFGPDVVASITTDELKRLVEGVHFIKRANSNPVDKGQMAEDLEPMRKLFTKSIVFRQDLPAGTIISEKMLSLKKPGNGLSSENLPELIGKRLIKSVKMDDRVSENDFE